MFKEAEPGLPLFLISLFFSYLAFFKKKLRWYYVLLG